MKTKIVKVKTNKGKKLYDVQIKHLLNWESSFKVKNGKFPKLFNTKKKAKKAEKRLISFLSKN